MRYFLCLLLVLCGAAQAQPRGQRFVSIAFHDVVDRVEDLQTDSVTVDTLVRFLDWLKGTGWTPVSLDEVAAAARGARPLPDKAILLTFDDGFHSLYTRVYPLLKVYRFPVVSALVGSWMEGPAVGTVRYGGGVVPRSTFISWAEAREMQASGLVEFASHSHGLHTGVPANPQGNLIPAAITWRYDAATRSYEDDAQYRARIRGDLERSRRLMASELGRAPRALVWPFGRYTGPALAEAKAAGFSFALTLEPEPAYTGDLLALHRYYPSRNPSLGVVAANLRFDPSYPATRRIACVSLDGIAAAGDAAAQDVALGAMIEGLRALGANTAVIDAHAGLATAETPLGDVYFPTRLRPLRLDLLSRAVWQIRTRAGAEAFLRLPLAAAVAAVGEAAMPSLFADMMRHSAADGVVVDAPGGPAAIVAEEPGAIRARRTALDPATLDAGSRRALAAFRGAAAIDPRQRLMLALPDGSPNAGGPPDWADIGLLPPATDAAAIAATAGWMRAQGWLRPDVAGRVAFALPAQRQVEALRAAQRLGASAFALCPQMPPLPPSAALSAAFSAATYPHRP